MSSSIFSIRAKSNNFKAIYQGKKIEIAKAVFQTKVLHNEKIPEKVIEIAKRNKAPYFIELLNAKGNIQKEMVFIREENQVTSSEGMGRKTIAIGFIVNGEVVPSIEEKCSKGSFSKNGGHVEFNKTIEWYNGATEFFLDNKKVGSRGQIPEIKGDK